VTPGTPIKDLLSRLNELDECRDIEAKRSEAEVGKSALETVSAFANEPGLGGGVIVFGIGEEEGGTFVARGVANPKKIEQEISSICASAFNRTIRPRVLTGVVEGKHLVAAFIPEAAAPEKPIFIAAKGMQHGSFRRIGSTDQKCTEDDLRVLFQAASLTPYEDTIVEDATMADLDDEVIGIYRRSLIEANPATELRDVTLDELVQSLGGARRNGGDLVPTVAGVLLFGKRLSLRRLFPAARVDYIRVPGTEWVPDPDRRYESIEVREPLLVAFRRIYNAIVDDLPKSFALDPGRPERRDQLALPEAAIREALVNALTHRDYRVPSAVQVLRYKDRIEVRNPGYSLVEDDHLGDPGSFPRNPRTADVFREMRLAENKGTGISAIRKVMKRAGLTPPLFDSDRARNLFVITLWLHNLIDEEDTHWLASFADARLSDAQARALVVARRAGSVTNAMLRALSDLDTLAASKQLNHLRTEGLLETRGRGAATHYVLGPRARAATASAAPISAEPRAADRASPTTAGAAGPAQLSLMDRPDPGLDRPDLGSDRPDLGSDRPESAPVSNLPSGLRQRVAQLGSRPREGRLREVIAALCAWRALKPAELGDILGIRADNLAKRHLAPMVEAGVLVRTYPRTPNHPDQAYRAVPSEAER